jgi:putative alpha-1,2-mannosidase
MRQLASLFCLVAAATVAVAADVLSYVDTRIGTGGVGFGIGSTNPGAQVPFGALRLGPDTSLGFGA